MRKGRSLVSPPPPPHHPPLIALVQISATDSVAILIHCNHSCPFVQFVGKKISLRTSAWNFRASECRVELVRAMPSAAEKLEEEAVQSEAMVTGYEVLGRSDCIDSAWNFRASERRAELVRAMPSAAENLEEVALRHRTCLNHPPPHCISAD